MGASATTRRHKLLNENDLRHENAANKCRPLPVPARAANRLAEQLQCCFRDWTILGNAFAQFSCRTFHELTNPAGVVLMLTPCSNPMTLAQELKRTRLPALQIRRRFATFRPGWTMVLTTMVIALGLLSSSFATTSSAQDDDPVQAKVMSFNIRLNTSSDGPNAWPHRKEIVAELIRAQELDMFGLQEALPDQASFLKESFPEFESFGAGRDDGDKRGEQVTVFYRRDRWEVLDKGHFWLSETPEVPGSKSWDTSITRMATWVLLQDRNSESKVFYVNTHYDHRGAEARRQSALLMRKHLPELAKGTPIILTGDFNCRDDQAPYKAITNEDNDDVFLRDAREICLTDPEGPNSTWSGFRGVEDNRRIDFIFVDPRIKVSKHQILDQTFDGRFPSDHLPVVATLEIPNE